jgi:hypothetical protein
MSVIDLDAYRWRRAQGVEDVEEEEGFDFADDDGDELVLTAVPAASGHGVEGQQSAGVPRRNGGPVAGLTPAQDWAEAQRIDRAVRTGMLAPNGHILSARTFSAGPWANWTVYRTLGYWHDLVWAAGLFFVFCPTAIYYAFTASAWFMVPWTAGLLAWTFLCQIPAESDAKMRRRAARSADA